MPPCVVFASCHNVHIPTVADAKLRWCHNGLANILKMQSVFPELAALLQPTPLSFHVGEGHLWEARIRTASCTGFQGTPPVEVQHALLVVGEPLQVPSWVAGGTRVGHPQNSL